MREHSTFLYFFKEVGLRSFIFPNLSLPFLFQKGSKEVLLYVEWNPDFPKKSIALGTAQVGPEGHT